MSSPSPSFSPQQKQAGMRSTTQRRHSKVRAAYESWVSKVSKSGKQIYSQEHIISTIAEDYGYSERYTEDIIFHRV
ncbi:MAG: hypothetical protein CL843_16350 [Crocinitomicaceae bacterium]|nr:hypothetical protein [Crocinitomicaceae bacterium]